MVQCSSEINWKIWHCSLLCEVYLEEINDGVELQVVVSWSVLGRGERDHRFYTIITVFSILIWSMAVWSDLCQSWCLWNVFCDKYCIFFGGVLSAHMQIAISYFIDKMQTCLSWICFFPWRRIHYFCICQD